MGRSWWGVIAIVFAVALLSLLTPDGSLYEPSGATARRTLPDHSAPRLRNAFGFPKDRIPVTRPDPARPSSLRGTTVDGALPVDDDGHLMALPEVLRLFEYYFATSGEESDDAILARIEGEIDARLEEPARSEARDLLKRFVRYRDEAAGLFAAGGDDVPIPARIKTISALRREVFGEDADSLFGPELKYAGVAARLQEVATDSSLTEDEKRRRMAELERELPDEVREARAAAAAPLDLARDEAALRAAGGDEDEVRALREQRFGAEAADRLADLDRRRDEWRGRIDDYRRQRSKIEADTTLTAEQREAEIVALLESSFDEPERRRVVALDRIELEGRDDSD